MEVGEKADGWMRLVSVCLYSIGNLDLDLGWFEIALGIEFGMKTCI